MESSRSLFKRTLASLETTATGRGNRLGAEVYREASEHVDELFSGRPVGEAVAVATKFFQAKHGRARWEDERMAWDQVVRELGQLLADPV